jgi:TatD DNase family protein
MEGIFDSHAHYDNEKFSEDYDQVIMTAKNNGVCAILNAGCDMKSSHNGIELSKKYPFIFSSVGVHPHDTKSLTKNDLATLEELAKNKSVVGIGEIGLDYHYDYSPRDIQKQAFISQMDLAKKLDLPVIIHSREATADTLEIVQKYELKGVVHCFSGSAETAKKYLDMNYYIGFTGVVTFANAHKVIEALKVVPLDKLLLETDCPYMAPVPFRGKRATSDMIEHIAIKIAQIKGVFPQLVIDTARKNTCNLFRIDESLLF